jgi:hypothetical protein
MDKEQKAQLEATRAVLRQMMLATGDPNPTQLAKRAGVTHTTLTRIMKDDEAGPDVTWALSGATWMKLSGASGVPVTLLGEKILVPGLEPGDSYIIKDRVQARLLRFWDRLSEEGKDLVLAAVDSWAERVALRRKSE